MNVVETQQAKGSLAGWHPRVVQSISSRRRRPAQHHGCRRHDARHGRPAGCRGPDDTVQDGIQIRQFAFGSSPAPAQLQDLIRPDEADRCPGDGAADQRINDTRQRDFKALAKQVKAQQHQQRNKHRGMGVLHVTEGKKQHAGLRGRSTAVALQQREPAAGPAGRSPPRPACR